MPGLSFKEKLSNQVPVEIKSVDILTNLELIQQVSTDATMEEAEKVWPVLKASLNTELGYGLAAIQIGIPKRIGYIRYDNKDYYLLNTQITERNGETPLYGEGCLSIPNKTFNTMRSQSITVTDDVLGKLSLDESTDGLLAMVFQHEVDHFDGITLHERQRKPIIREGNKIGRNDPCPCGSNKKYKKCCIAN